MLAQRHRILRRRPRHHETLLLERVERIGEDRLLVTYATNAEVHRGRVAAQLFERIEEP